MDYEEVKGLSISDHNDHYVEAEDDFDVKVYGVTGISIDRDSVDFENFDENMHQESISIDNIESMELCQLDDM